MKIGDKVRVTHTDGYHISGQRVVGQEGIIARTGCFDWIVNIDGHDYSFKTSELEVLPVGVDVTIPVYLFPDLRVTAYPNGLTTTLSSRRANQSWVLDKAELMALIDALTTARDII